MKITTARSGFRSWTINHDSDFRSISYESTTFQKIRLLLWKNYKIQIRHKVQTVMEIVLPLLFTLVLVVLRNFVPSIIVTENKIYKPLILEENPPGALLQCDQIFYTPNNSVVGSLMGKVEAQYFSRNGLKYEFIGFKTEKDLVDAYVNEAKIHAANFSTDLDSSVRVLAGVVFTNEFPNDTFPRNLQYSLRFPASQRSSFSIISERFGIKPSWFTELTYPLFQLLGPRSKDDFGGGLPGYNEEGFLYLQYAVDRTLTRELLPSSELETYNGYDIKLRRFPYPPFIDDKYLFALQGWLPLIIMLSFIYPVINITKSVLYEKEKRLKEYMKIMGLSNGIHWSAWYLKSYLFLLISVGIMTILLKTKIFSSQTLAVLPKSDASLIFFLFMVFTASLICFAFFVSTLFSHANAGATAAGVLWFVFYVPYGFLQPRYNLLSRQTKLLSCLFSNTAIAFSCQIICMFEGTGAGIQWKTIFQGSGPDDNFSLGDCIIMMAVNAVLYMTSALYIEAVHPGEFGVPLPFFFPLSRLFSMKKSNKCDYEKNEMSTMTQENEYVEPVPKSRIPGIRIDNLSKIYENGKVAVSNVTLNFYEGITAFLGPNGAGKTTTLSILSGIFPPSSGTAYINNCDIRNDIKSARTSLGLCPQYDVLFDELTVEEHLRFYCLLKGLSPNSVNDEIEKMVKAIGLDEKRNALSCTLSGGMRRKLSVGIAFSAGSKVVLLDEPSSGMDPGARRSTWDLIKSEKNKRTIVLSTHYMEEADVLGDRIAIMAAGQIQCCGSSLFLKQKYGGGYQLIIVKEDGCCVDSITQLIKKAIPQVKLSQDVSAEVSYSLPDDQSHLFQNLFEELETKREELKIASYGASNTTMEEVFMRVGELAEAKVLAQHSQELHPPKSDNDKLQTSLYSGLEEPPRHKGLNLKAQQFLAMLTKKAIYGWRNHTLLLAQMGIPILYLVLILLILKNLPGISDPPPHVLSLDKYEKLGRTITTLKCPSTASVCQSYRQFVSGRYLIEEIGTNTTFVDFILEKEMEDLVTVNFRYILGLEQKRINDSDTRFGEIVGFFNNQPFHSPPLALNFISNAILLPTNSSITLTNHPFPLSSIDNFKHIGSLYTLGFQIGYNVAFGMSFLAASFAVFLIAERESRSKHLQFVSGVDFYSYWIANFLVDYAQFILPCFGIMMILFTFGIEDYGHLNMQGYLLLLQACYGWAVIPMTYFLSFAFTVPTSGFTRLVLLNIFTGMATMLTVVIMQIPEFHLGEIADVLNSLFVLFPNYALGMGIVQLSANYQFTKDCPLQFNLEFFCESFPNTVCCAKLKSNFLDWEQIGIGKNLAALLSSGVVYWILLALMERKVLQRIFSRESKAVRNEASDQDLNEADGLEDSDVHSEKMRIQNTQLTKLLKENTLVMKNLTKRYEKFTAVDQISLGVQKGECFGLLGVNGAGKTSTFKMLTGDLSISEGGAYICSKSVRKDLREVHKILGYCPQFDALIEEMTGEETIQLYARLRGIQESYIPQLTTSLGEILLFGQYLNKPIKSYSGGNKRKLSTAIALIGSPPIIFLDEMTTGMDPVARRQMWSAISNIRDRGASIILTSHSMNECEALCTRLAIMVNGQFRCLGSPQHLKSKFGEGYTLIAQMAPSGIPEGEPFTRAKQELGRRRSSLMSFRKAKSTEGWESELEELRGYIEQNFPGCVLKDIHPGFVHYQVPREGTSWGLLFSKMEAAKGRFKLEAYSVGQCTLEQVFLSFSKGQINAE